MKTFEELLGKNNPLLKSVKNRGFEMPSEIQEKSIPAVMEGKDIIAGASTGSGKTLAFAAGIIKNSEKDFGIQSLVLTPTRELAEQITNELTDFSKYKKLEVVSVYGGVSIINQIKKLADADIVVGTPGRILDHIERNSIDLSRIKTLVLDEADRMLDMGFIDDVEKIISKCQKKRQTMLFSATISSDIARLAQKHLNNPVEISAEQYVDPKKLNQVYYDVDDYLKYSLLKHLLESEKAQLIMIFCNTRKNVDFVANNLMSMGIESVPIHGGFTQDKRNRMLSEFHSNKVRVLVATDVAARGLDIKGVSHIYNYDIPPSKNEYIHRIGRTARAGSEGKVINLVSGRDYENFSSIITGDFNITKIETPFIEKVRMRWMPEKRHFGGRFGRREGRRNDSREHGSRRSHSHEREGRRFSSDRKSFHSRDSRRDNRKRFSSSERHGSQNQRSSSRRFSGRRF